MKKQNVNLEDAAILRQKAEDQLVKQQTNRALSYTETDMLKLIHELEVHQIELEMQNEELTIAEEKYIELYDFAPSGYLTISKKVKFWNSILLPPKCLARNVHTW